MNYFNGFIVALKTIDTLLSINKILLFIHLGCIEFPLLKASTVNVCSKFFILCNSFIIGFYVRNYIMLHNFRLSICIP